MDNNLCTVRDLTKYYGKKKVFEDLSLEVSAGQLIGLTGENGSGKSTFLKCILGFVKPTRGKIRLEKSRGYSPQENYLNGKLTVKEHFNFFKLIYGRNYMPDDELFDSLYGTFKLDKYSDYLIENLSSGTYQKVKLMTSLFHNPRILILDEPYEGFDWQMYLEFWKIAERLVSEKKSLLMVSHLIYDKVHFDKIYELREGRLYDAK